jgi:para-nitrobenzyl esterase
VTGASPTGEHVVVETKAGAVRGFWRPGSAAFLGIPFAEPPFGELRFQAPQPRSPWSGVRDALEYAATPQRKALAEITAIPEPSIPGDDILNLNVFTPDPSTGSSLPVLVYIHGGGYIAGSPASPWYDGAAFNRDGVVTVSVSYRLGFDGFGWLPDAPANRAVLDWLLALEWVRDNISAFGGDSQRVTIAGQSAGGGAVMTLLTQPQAQGLFSAVMSLSGATTDIPLDVAKRTTEGLAAKLGVQADRAGFASVSEADLLAAQGGIGFLNSTEPTADDLLADLRAMEGALRLGPIVDGSFRTQGTADAIRAGVGADVALLAGSTKDEFSGVARAFRSLFEGHDVASVLDRLGLEHEAALRFAAALPEHHPAEVVGQVVTDRMFRRHVVEWLDIRQGPAPTWAYDFKWPSQVTGTAGHCLDVPFFFDCLEHPAVARLAGDTPPQALADAMHAAMVGLIRDHNPGWPSYAESESVMVFDEKPELVHLGYESARAMRAK